MTEIDTADECEPKASVVFYATKVFVVIAIVFGTVVAIAHLLGHLLDVSFLVGAFGALSAVLFGLHGEKPARLRNVGFGHVISGVIGVSAGLTVSQYSVEAGVVLAVAASIAVMLALDVLHPPGGAVALIAASSPDSIAQSPFQFVIGITIVAILYWVLSRLGVKALLAKPRVSQKSS